MRYILIFRGEGPRPEGDVAAIRAQPHVKIVDAAPRMLLVEGPPDDVRTLMDSLPDWAITEERTVPRPDPRPKVKRRVVSDDEG